MFSVDCWKASIIDIVASCLYEWMDVSNLVEVDCLNKVDKHKNYNIKWNDTFDQIIKKNGCQ